MRLVHNFRYCCAFAVQLANDESRREFHGVVLTTKKRRRSPREFIFAVDKMDDTNSLAYN